MAQCQLCESLRAVVVDREMLPAAECDKKMSRVLEFLAQEVDFKPVALRLQLIRCSNCGKTYRRVLLPIALEASFAKGYLRSGG